MIGNFAICPYNYLNGQIGIEIKTYKDIIKHLKVIEEGLDSPYVTLEKKYKVFLCSVKDEGIRKDCLLGFDLIRTIVFKVI